MISMIMILYFCIETADNTKLTRITYKDLFNNVKDLHDYMLYDLKPRTVIIDRVLSYQLPTAIVKAFEISHTDLRETLEGVVVDLAKLTEVYRALLGFNSDWGLEENAQRLKCSWEAKTIKEEARDNSPELAEHMLKVNTSIEQVRSMYGDFAGVRLEIENLFNRIRNYIEENLNDGSNSTMIQLDYFTENATKVLNKSINTIKQSVLSNFAQLVSSNFKLRNQLIDLKIQGAIDATNEDFTESNSGDDYIIRNSQPRIYDISKDSKRMMEQLKNDNLFLTRYHKRLGKLVKYSVNNNIILRSDQRLENNTGKTIKGSRNFENPKSKKTRRSSSEDQEVASTPKNYQYKGKIKFSDLQKVYTSREQAMQIEILNKRHRYNPLNTLISMNKTQLENYYKLLTKEFEEFNNGSNLGLFYSLTHEPHYSPIRARVNRKLSRMRRFTFIPHLTAYELPLSRMSVRPKESNKGPKVKIQQTSKTTQRILSEFAAKNRILLKTGHYWDNDIDPLGLCYVGAIPGYKLVHCPTDL